MLRRATKRCVLRTRSRKATTVVATVGYLPSAEGESATLPLPLKGSLPVIPGYEVLRSWAAAAWASSTRPGRSRLNRVVALKMILAGGHAGRRTSWPASAPRRRRSPACSTATSCRSSRSASTTGQPFFSLEFCAGGSLDQQAARHAAAGRARPPRWCETLAEAMHAAHRQRHHPPRPEAGQRACCAEPTATAEDHRLRPGQEAGREPGKRHPAPSWARRRTWPRSRRAATPTHRPGGGRLRAGRHPLRAADGPAAVPGGDAAGHAPAGAARRAGAAAAVAAADAARPGNDLPEMPAQGGSTALRDGGGIWRRI